VRAPVWLVLAASLSACAAAPSEPVPDAPPHHVVGGFRNLDPDYQRPGAWARLKFFARRGWQSIIGARPYAPPRMDNDGRALREGAGDPRPTVTWIGHSTLLVQLDGLNVLTDPQWSERSSPLSWAGPRRLAPPGIAFEALPPIHVVVISHDHYDHLDLPTVRRLAAAHDPLFLVPLGLKAWLAERGVVNVRELDWWGSHVQGPVRFVCVPAQHWSQRALGEMNPRLWASWAAIGPTRRLYVSGDTGYFAGFREAGERLGPFDLVALPIGAYLPSDMMRWNHTTPEEAVQAFEDLRGRVLLGVHWGTFDLSDEPLDEPPVRMRAEARRRGIPDERAWILQIGETRRW
jgi:N-acyl-phosphatidylethanolamine-hydrolysing phospholipase D